jgi:hypothetical protein
MNFQPLFPARRRSIPNQYDVLYFDSKFFGEVSQKILNTFDIKFRQNEPENSAQDRMDNR